MGYSVRCTVIMEPDAETPGEAIQAAGKAMKAALDMIGEGHLEVEIDLATDDDDLDDAEPSDLADRVLSGDKIAGKALGERFAQALLGDIVDAVAKVTEQSESNRGGNRRRRRRGKKAK